MADESENCPDTPLPGNDRATSNLLQAAIASIESPVSDDVGRILANDRRRYVLHCLTTAETPMAVADLADDLVRWETDTSSPAVQDAREQVYISLYHWHLPKLADADLIAFDVDRKLVDICEAANDLPLTGGQPSADEHPHEKTADNGHRQ